jgi:hypothetical protein
MIAGIWYSLEVVAGKHRSCDSRGLAGEIDRHTSCRSALEQLGSPGVGGIVSAGKTDDCRCANDEETPDMAVAPIADADQSLLSPGAVISARGAIDPGQSTIPRRHRDDWRLAAQYALHWSTENGP